MSNQARFIRWEVDKIKNIIRARDFNKCVLCTTVRPLHIHHIVSIFEDISLATELTNLVCLCDSCHKKAHPNGSKSIDEAIRQQLKHYISGVSCGL
jgi:5-methylcytosine-specific restriction endonuclease McrA